MNTVFDKPITSYENTVQEFKEKMLDTDNISDKIKFLLERKFHLFTLEADITPERYFRLISGLAEACPSTALSISMHLYTVWGLKYILTEEQKEKFLSKIYTEDALFGSFNEPGVYFINPGQLRMEEFPVHAAKDETGYVVNGFKKFVSLEPFVRFLPTYCLVDQYSGNHHGIVALMLDKNADGATPINDWSMVGMSDTCSNSVKFENVVIPKDHVIYDEEKSFSGTEVQGYLFRLSVASVYYGIAKKAVSYITEKAKSRKVPHTGKSLANFPGVQFTLAEILILLDTSLAQMMRCCNQLHQFMADKDSLQESTQMITLITKEYVTSSADEIVRKAMKIEGIQSLSKSNMLSSLYNDVKAGRFHPPQTDITYELIAKEQLGVVSFKNRWC